MKYPICTGGIVLIAALLSACQQGSAPARSTAAPAVSYVTVTEAPHTIATKMQARVVASQVAEVRPQVSGIVQQRLFEEGSKVEQGQLLYQIDPATFQAAYNEAKANLNSAKASLATAQLKAQRYANLRKFDGISQQDADDAQASYLEAKAELEKYQAELESAAINLEYTKVKASIAGHIGISSVTQGALVTAQQATALATIRSLDPIYVDMRKGSAELLKLRQLMRNKSLKQGSTAVTLTLEDGSDYPYQGELKMQEVSVDAATGTVTLRAQFPNPDGLLLPGMFVRAQVSEAVDEHAILVPQQGIYHSANGDAYAYVIGDNNLVEKRIVKTVNAVDNQWLIASGLAVNDKLLVEGSSNVRPGTEVQPVQVEMNSSGSMVTVLKPAVNNSPDNSSTNSTQQEGV
ncbi:efflux RND transporter periplasmic adaptor subunit [Dasania sp. GY-MA-18]|uniref:Efflux RND transporter periplasmic adaptor subunit n=1 Tax=Dasania phycosphaerae TaxID=2950436 RepID=A0A9J6RNX9_9GAMM|nr:MULTISPECIES: efflux RND transporter periplasmic adaptor subunit [Dasania]MCR8923817.1 efflux RND transporter periplasmic adaptor subunit [Dasania sp. GY-MA-18]MCZ0866251.1 efflux RND transporter periplasmic adaptor subunit [Dasania phycosphaerae]MCZ0869975.1 efflux RND transporter periplasmic adaptor subunit [Dasania phycosphaerae]